MIDIIFYVKYQTDSKSTMPPLAMYTTHWCTKYSQYVIITSILSDNKLFELKLEIIFRSIQIHYFIFSNKMKTVYLSNMAQQQCNEDGKMI